MTVSSEVSVAGPFYGNGTTKTFPYSFKILDAKHIRAVLISAPGDVSDLSLDNGDYTVSGVGSETGGDIIKATPLLAGQTLTLVRRLPLTQETSLENQGAYYPEVVERRLDQMVMQIQSVKEATDRSLTVEPGQEKPSMTQIAATQGYAQAAKQSRDESAELATAAASSASNASGSAALASRWASESENVPVAAGLFSAFHWYRKAYAIYQTITQAFLEKVGGILTGDVLFGPGTGGKYSKIQANGDVQLNRGDNTGYITWNVANAYHGWDGTRYVYGPAGGVTSTGGPMEVQYGGNSASYTSSGDHTFSGAIATEFGGTLSAALREANRVKAWVNFNGTGTVSIRASKNVSSVADNGTGDYIVNFITPMPDVNFIMVGTGSGEVAGASVPRQGPSFATENNTTTSCRVKTGYDDGSLRDWATVGLAFIR